MTPPPMASHAGSCGSNASTVSVRLSTVVMPAQSAARGEVSDVMTMLTMMTTVTHHDVTDLPPEARPPRGWACAPPTSCPPAPGRTRAPRRRSGRRRGGRRARPPTARSSRSGCRPSHLDVAVDAIQAPLGIFCMENHEWMEYTKRRLSDFNVYA